VPKKKKGVQGRCVNKKEVFKRKMGHPKRAKRQKPPGKTRGIEKVGEEAERGKKKVPWLQCHDQSKGEGKSALGTKNADKKKKGKQIRTNLRKNPKGPPERQNGT